MYHSAAAFLFYLICFTLLFTHLLSVILPRLCAITPPRHLNWYCLAIGIGLIWMLLGKLVFTPPKLDGGTVIIAEYSLMFFVISTAAIWRRSVRMVSTLLSFLIVGAVIMFSTEIVGLWTATDHDELALMFVFLVLLRLITDGTDIKAE